MTANATNRRILSEIAVAALNAPSDQVFDVGTPVWFDLNNRRNFGDVVGFGVIYNTDRQRDLFSERVPLTYIVIDPESGQRFIVDHADLNPVDSGIVMATKSPEVESESRIPF